MVGTFKQRSSDTTAVHLAALAQHPPASAAAGYDAVLLGDSYFERFLKPHLGQTQAAGPTPSAPAPALAPSRTARNRSR